jgi:hypothetical protein
MCNLTEKQREAILAFIGGRDTFVVLPTGTGSRSELKMNCRLCRHGRVRHPTERNARSCMAGAAFTITIAHSNGTLFRNVDNAPNYAHRDRSIAVDRSLSSPLGHTDCVDVLQAIRRPKHPSHIFPRPCFNSRAYLCSDSVPPWIWDKTVIYRPFADRLLSSNLRAQGKYISGESSLLWNLDRRIQVILTSA